MATLSKLMGSKKNGDISDILRSAFFGEKKKPRKKTTPSQEKTVQTNSDESQIALLRSIAANARISARNSMALPSILQQTNIMQKNVAKLVRIQGVKSTSAASSFFSDSKFRENAYEAQYRKGMGDSKSPSQQNKPEGKNLLGLLGAVGGIFKSLFSSNFLMKMIVGSGLVLGLSKYFSDPKFKEQVDNLMTNIRKAFISDEGWMKFKQGVADVGKALLLLGGTLVAFKLALAYLSGVMFRMGTGGMIPGVGIPGGGPGRQRRGPGSRGRFGNFMRSPAGVAIALGTAGIAYGASELQQWADEPVSTSPETVPPGAAAYQQVAQSPEQTNASGMPGKGEMIAAGATTYYAAGMAKDVARRGDVLSRRSGLQDKLIDKWKVIIRKVRTKGYGGYLVHKVEKRLMKSKIGMRIVKKAVTFLLGLLVPGPGWVSSLIAGAFLLWDVLWIVDIVTDVFNEMLREEADQKSAVAAANSPTPGSNVAAGTDFSGVYDEDKQQSPLASAFKSITEAASAAFPWLAPLNAMNLSNLFGNRADGGLGGGATLSELKGIRDSATAQQAMDFFQSKGWSKEQAAGIVGNLVAESNLKTDAVGDGGKAYGIAQWHADRQARFKQVYGKDIRQSNINEQMEFVDWELRNSEKSAGDKLKGATSASDAAFLVDKYYERSAGFHRKKRMDLANALAFRTQSFQPRGLPGISGPLPETPDSNLFNAPIPKSPTSPVETVGILRVNPDALAKPASAVAGPVLIDASKTFNAPVLPGASGSAPAATQLPYNWEWLNLSDSYRNSIWK